MAAQLDARQQRGMALAAEKASLIQRLRKDEWLVPSQATEGDVYRVKLPRNLKGERTHAKCTCPDFTNRGLPCKHIWAVRFVLTIQGGEDVLVQTHLPASAERKAPARPAQAEPSGIACKWCSGTEVQRYGMCGKKQAYWCKPCERKFVVEDGFKRLKGDAKVVTLALDLYFKGVSLRQITDTLEQFFSVKVSHVTVYNWLNRYVTLLNDYAATLKPEVGTAKWHADEMKVKYGADWRWLWHVMDRETRYLLVSKVTEGRDTSDAMAVFRAAKAQANGETPDVIVTDGLGSYVDASKRVFNAGRKRDARHEREIHLSKPQRMPNNNMVERLNGTVRGRQRPARGLKSPKGPLTRGQAAYYNLVRPHEALDGKTPAEAAGLDVPTEGNRWKHLIDDVSASKNRRNHQR